MVDGVVADIVGWGCVKNSVPVQKCSEGVSVSAEGIFFAPEHSYVYRSLVVAIPEDCRHGFHQSLTAALRRPTGHSCPQPLTAA